MIVKKDMRAVNHIWTVTVRCTVWGQVCKSIDSSWSITQIAAFMDDQHKDGTAKAKEVRTNPR